MTARLPYRPGIIGLSRLSGQIRGYEDISCLMVGDVIMPSMEHLTLT